MLWIWPNLSWCIYNHKCKFQSNCIWTWPFWQLMTSLQSYQVSPNTQKCRSPNYVYVPVCKTHRHYIKKKFTQNMNNFQFYNFLSWQISSKFYNNDRSGKESLRTHILQEKVCNEWGDNNTRKHRTHCCHWHL